MMIILDNLCVLYQVLLCFSRDTAVLEHFSYNSANPPKSYIQGNVFIVYGSLFECAFELRHSLLCLVYYYKCT